MVARLRQMVDSRGHYWSCGRIGMRYWQQQQVRVRQQASLLYQQLIVADSQKNRDTVTQMAAELTQRYPNTEYAALGNLVAAKSAVNANNLAGAQQKLQWTLEHSKAEAVRQIARLRVSRVLLAQNKPGEAQKLLSVVEDKSFQPAIDGVQGDIYLALGEASKAHQSYQSAQTGLSASWGRRCVIIPKTGPTSVIPAGYSGNYSFLYPALAEPMLGMKGEVLRSLPLAIPHRVGRLILRLMRILKCYQ